MENESNHSDAYWKALGNCHDNCERITSVSGICVFYEDSRDSKSWTGEKLKVFEQKAAKSSEESNEG